MSSTLMARSRFRLSSFRSVGVKEMVILRASGDRVTLPPVRVKEESLKREKLLEDWMVIAVMFRVELLTVSVKLRMSSPLSISSVKLFSMGGTSSALNSNTLIPLVSVIGTTSTRAVSSTRDALNVR